MVPTVPPARDAVVTVGGVATVLIVKFRLSVLSCRSATLMRKEDGPTVVGRPLMIPLNGNRLNPGGSDPETNSQE